MRVAVIGAGFSGLAAADYLRRAGHEVIVIEARDRVGGRVWSETLPNGAVIERGAEFIVHDEHIIQGTIKRLGLSLAPTGMAYGDREPRDLDIDRKKLIDGYDSLNANATQLADDPSRSANDVFNQVDLDPQVRAAIQARMEISSATSATELSSTSLTNGVYRIDSRESYRTAGGNQRIAIELARPLGGDVHLGKVVHTIVWGPRGARILLDRWTLGVDRVVVTVPANVLEKIRFAPELPEWKRTANSNIRYGHAAKLYVPLNEPAEPSAVMSVAGRYWSWTAQGEDGSVQPVVSCFAGTSKALDELNVSNGPETWVRKLQTLRPELALDPENSFVSTWDDDPWIGAAYSVSLAGHPRDYDALAEPVGPVHFAGEHTQRESGSTMDGALRSGYRAAREIAGDLPEDA